MNTIKRLITWEAEAVNRSWQITSAGGGVILTLRENTDKRLFEQVKGLTREEFTDAIIDIFDTFVEESIAQFHGFSGRS